MTSWAFLFGFVFGAAFGWFAYVLRIEYQQSEPVCPFCDTMLTSPFGCTWCARHPLPRKENPDV